MTFYRFLKIQWFSTNSSEDQYVVKRTASRDLKGAFLILSKPKEEVMSENYPRTLLPLLNGGMSAYFSCTPISTRRLNFLASSFVFDFNGRHSP